jgi:hypothetical protein
MIWVKAGLAFLAIAGYGAMCGFLGYVYRGYRTAALGTVEPSPWRDYHSKETKP